MHILRGSKKKIFCGIFLFLFFSITTISFFAPQKAQAVISLDTGVTSAVGEAIDVEIEKLESAIQDQEEELRRLNTSGGNPAEIRQVMEEIAAKKDLLEEHKALRGGFRGGGFFQPVLDFLLGAIINFGATLLIILGGFLQFLVSAIVSLSVGLFDVAMEISIDKFHTYFDAGGAVQTAWTAFRNIINIGFIFILLYIAINTILQSSSFDTKKMLGKVIIAALLVNFSFFFASLIIDVANNMAASIYESAQEKARPSGGSIGNYFFDHLGIGKVVDELNGGGGKEASAFRLLDDTFFGDVERVGDALIFESIENVAGVFIALVFGIVVALTFTIGAILLVGRLIVLILLLITSPIGFVGSILPKTEKYSKDWWNGIIGQSFFLPLFLFFLWVAMQLAEAYNSAGLTKTSGPGTLTSGSAIAANISNIAPVIINFAILIGLFLAALFAAKKLSTSGGAIAADISKRASTVVGKGVFGAAGYTARNTLGRLGNVATNSEWLKDKAKNSTWARLALKGADKFATSSFDARGSSAFKGVASATGIGEKEFGEASTTKGYREQLEKQREARTKFAAEQIGQIDDDDLKPDAAGKTIKERLKKAEEDLEELEELKGTAAYNTPEEKDKRKIQKKIIKQRQEEYAKQKNARIKAYADDLKEGPIFGVIPKLWTSKKNKDAAKTIEKELDKASKDGKHDPIKALKGKKGKESESGDEK